MRIKIIAIVPVFILIACAHLKKARQSYHHQDYQKALSLCKTAIAEDSTDIEAQLLLSRIYMALDLSGQSLEILSGLMKSEDLSRKQKSLIIDQMLIHIKGNEGSKQSISLLTQAEQLDSMHIKLLDTLAGLFDEQREYKKAKIRYYRLIDLSKDPLPYISRVNAIEHRLTFAADEFEKGMKALHAGNMQKAEEHLKKSAQTNPHFIPAVYEYGMLAGDRLYRTGSQQALNEAIDVLRQAVKVKSCDVKAHYLLAKVCERKGHRHLQEAIDHYHKVILLARNSQYAENSQKRIGILEKRKSFWEKGKTGRSK